MRIPGMRCKQTFPTRREHFSGQHGSRAGLEGHSRNHGSGRRGNTVRILGTDHLPVLHHPAGNGGHNSLSRPAHHATWRPANHPGPEYQLTNAGDHSPKFPGVQNHPKPEEKPQLP